MPEPDTRELTPVRNADGRGKPDALAIGRLCFAALCLFICVYVVAYSSKSIAAYATGNTLFDLGAFEQGFWNATRGTLFFYSLEGEMSRFGRHFSPIFFLMLPVYALHRDPSTLLILQSLALGLAAIPLYWFSRIRSGSSMAALVISSLYLINPALHDVNIVNEFHEIAFAVPLLFLAFYAILSRRWGLYAVAVAGALMTKEEVAFTVAMVGIYVLIVARRWRVGLATLFGSLVWFVAVTQLIMPGLRGSYGPVPFFGYEYLGEGIFGIAAGIFTKPGALFDVMAGEAKQAYIYWLLQPVAFVALLSPEVLAGTAPALLVILASTSPYTYAIFERYVAPVIPFVFIATAVAVGRIRHLLQVARLSPFLASVVVALVLVGMGVATGYAQLSLRKLPTQLLYSMEPDPHAATAIKFTEAIPERATVTAEDNRWLARLAHRKYLYILGWSPNTEYLLLDRKVAPITMVPKEAREQSLRRMMQDADYRVVRCEDGLALYARSDAYERDGDLFTPMHWDQDRADNFGGLIQLRGYSLDKDVVHPGDSLVVTLYWQALRQPIRADYTVFVNVLDDRWVSVGQHDGRPQSGTCLTLDWTQGLIVEDSHPLTIRPDAPRGKYNIRVGLYTFADMKRLNTVGPDGKILDDNVALPLLLR